MTIPKIDYSHFPIEPVQIPFTRQSKWPEQHGKCFWCGIPLKGRRKSYCSNSHSKKYNNFFSWRRVRVEVFNREECKCKNCHKDVWFSKQYNPKEYKLDDLGEVDHIIPINGGGNYWNLENCQLLCHRCHREKTTRTDPRFKNNPKNRLIPLTEFIK